jgi:hypothetical protein
MTRNGLIGKYLVAVEERDALNEGTLTAEETAGYWLAEAPHNPRAEFTRMLKDLDILLSQNSFYNEVWGYIKEVS